MRNDATLHGRTVEERERAFLLYDQLGNKAPAAIYKEMGIKISVGALSSFYAGWPFQRTFLQARTLADDVHALLKARPDLKLAPEQINATAQAVFEVDAVRQMDRKGWLAMKSARQKDHALSQEDRKIVLLEKRAAQADAAEKITATPNLTPEEKQAQYRRLFGMS